MQMPRVHSWSAIALALLSGFRGGMAMREVPRGHGLDPGLASTPPGGNLSGAGRRVLVTYASIGGGHKAAARAVIEKLREVLPGLEIHMVDLVGPNEVTFADGRVDGFTSKKVLKTLTKDFFLWARANAPWITNTVIANSDTRSMEQHGVPKALRTFEQFVLRHRWDLCIHTHFWGPMVLARLRKRSKMFLPQITVVTDFHAHAVWMENYDTDHFFVATDDVKEHLVADYKVHASAITPSGIPISPSVARLQAAGIAAARATLRAEGIDLPPGGGRLIVALPTSEKDESCIDVWKQVAKFVEAHPQHRAVMVAGRKEELRRPFAEFVDTASTAPTGREPGACTAIEHARAASKLAYPLCRCKANSFGFKQVYCNGRSVADGQLFNGSDIFEDGCKWPICDTKPRCEHIPGAKMRSQSFFPECKCANEEDVVWCNSTRLAERKFDANQVWQSCGAPRCGRGTGLAAGAVTTLGFTKLMPELLAAADLIITKPGGLTTSEALATGTGFLIMEKWLLDVEINNFKFLKRHQVAVGADGVNDVFAKLEHVLSPGKEGRAPVDAMKEVALSLGHPKSAEAVSNYVEKFLRETPVNTRPPGICCCDGASKCGFFMAPKSSKCPTCATAAAPSGCSFEWDFWGVAQCPGRCRGFGSLAASSMRYFSPQECPAPE